MMKPDPIVEEIRRGRVEHAEQCNYDISKIAADYRKKQKKYEDRLVSGNPKPIPRMEEIVI